MSKLNQVLLSAAVCISLTPVSAQTDPVITQWQNEFELHARAILGLPVNTGLRSPGASAVIYGGVDAAGIVFDGVDEALRVPNTDIRLFGKPESFVKR